ncbi:MAG: hypothetical protein HY512_03510 [Candidatus Aenigmarchaeota archaeon]|nr:hypothetical protein [Candidatus Aenigmarchaeota archaeon]
MGLIKLVIAVVIIIVAIYFVLNMFPGAGDKVKGVLSSTPLSGGATKAPESKTGEGFDMKIFPPGVYNLKSEGPVEVTTESGTIKNFTGSIGVILKNKTVVLTHEGSNLVVDLPLKTIAVTGVVLSKFDVVGSKIDVFSGNWRTQTDNGTLQIEGFKGGVLIENDYLKFVGNISSLRREGFS